MARRKRPSTPTLLRWPSRRGLCGRCSHFDRTIHAIHCQRCVWRHLAWTVIFGLRHTVLRLYIPRKLPFGYTFSRTMHHTSSQKGLRSGWQSGASEPHLLTRRCSNRRKFCGPSAPIAYATSGSSSAKPNYLISCLNGWSSLSFGIRFACWLPSCPNGSCMQLSIGNQLRISCMRPSVCSPPYLYLYSCFCWN